MKNKDQYRKIYAKIKAKENIKIFGITNCDNLTSKLISLNLAYIISETNKCLYIDFDNSQNNESEYANINQLFENLGQIKKDLDLYRLNFTTSDDVERIIESKEFENLFQRMKKEFEYIVINEKNSGNSQTFLTKKFEDGKILVVNETKTTKSSLNNIIKELEDMDIEVLGVIYNK